MTVEMWTAQPAEAFLLEFLSDFRISIRETGTRWPLAFRRAIGVALKDEENLHFVEDRIDDVLARATA